MNPIHEKYKRLCVIRTNINEHLPNLRYYASKCQHVTECGSCGVMSSFALARGLLDSRAGTEKKMVLIDVKKDETINVFAEDCKTSCIETVFYQESDLTCPVEETDMLFIDTWHVYGQMKRELERWSGSVKKYIVMHNTTVDEQVGENIRLGQNIDQVVAATGFERADVEKGLWPAIEEFLEAHPEWTLKERLTYNNGLTVLERC